MPLNTFEPKTLYATSSKGDIKVWRGSVKDVGDKSIIEYEFGLEKGKHQIQTIEVTEGKSIGRSNETTPYEQAVKMVESKYKKKRDKGYTEDKNNISTPILPMLALSFEKRKHNIKYPCYVQPKIDGVRMTCRMVNGSIEMFTRRGKPFTLMTHIEDELIKIFNNLERGETFYLDGELYSDTLTFQELAGIVRRSSNDEEILKQIHYVVFDCFDLNKPNWDWLDRWESIYHSITENYVLRCPKFPAYDENQIYKWNSDFIEQGYEGTIIRNMEGKYKLNHRSPDLQKYKLFLDDEYEIIGFKEGTNTDEGCVIWECKTPNGLEFSVRPRGTKEQRTEWFDNGESYIGSLLTVRFQELTDDGIPRFPVGITIRDYE
jgi:ATP-dependent DNA ligase